MPYIGNPIYQSAFVTDTFNGNGSTTAYTMSVAPAGVTNVLVVVSGVVQDPSTYGVVGNTLNFSTAPPSGTGNISCRYLGVPVTGVTTTAYRTVTEFTATSGQTTFTPPSYTVGYINVYRNGVRLGSSDYTASNGTTVVLATGATAGDLITTESFYVSSVLNAIANSPASVSASNMAAGSVVLSSSTVTGVLPIANGGTGVAGSTYTLEYLIIAGGGAGGNRDSGGGGGAGGVLNGSTTVTTGVPYNVTVGAGGIGTDSSTGYFNGANGGNSQFASFTAIGGGGGGKNAASTAGSSGGSGGGGSGEQSNAGGAGTSGQGNAGGSGDSAAHRIGGGGGGAGGAGTSGTSTGAGGVGTNAYSTWASATNTGVGGYYAGGGGGGAESQTAGSGGSGGGGSGTSGSGSSASPGVANTGSGGGGKGAGPNTVNFSGSGGSGLVIVRYLSASQKGLGGVVTSSGGYYYHTFTGSGVYTA